MEGNFQTGIANLVTSLTTADKVNIRNAIFRESFLASDIITYHDLRTDVRDGGLQTVVGRQADLYKGLQATTNERSCAMNTGTLTTDYSSKKWSIGEYNERIAICLRDVSEDFLVYWNMYRQRLENPLENPDDQAYLDFLLAKVEAKLNPTLWRISYLGDKSAVGATANLISNNNGLYVQAQVGNGEQIKITQTDPTGQQIYGYMKQLYDKFILEDWFNEDEFVWDMTRATAGAIVKMLNDANDQSEYNCTCIDPHQIVGRRFFNINNLTMFGLPVRVHSEIDHSKNAVGDTDKFEILLIRKGDTLIGTNTVDSLKDFDIFYDQKDRTIYMDASVYAGSMLLTDEYGYISTKVA